MNLLKSDRSDVLLLMGGWILVLLIINPVGNYPINDDWAYAQIVKRFVETGVYDLGFWPGMTLFTHIMWGSLFCKIFGFSFTVLRIATLCMAFLGSAVFLIMIRDLIGKDSWSRKVALGTLMFNPFFLLLSFSYMTDVPFLTFVLLSLFFFKKAFEKDRYRDWGLALLFSIVAILTRQLALILPLIFSGVLVLKFRDRKHIILAVSMVVLGFGSLYGYTSFMEATVGLPPPFGRPESLLGRLNFSFITGQIHHRGGVHLFYSSFFLIPFIALLNFSFKRPKRDFFLLAIAVGYFFFFSWHMIPIGNLFFITGFGPITLVDVERSFTLAERVSRSVWSVIIGMGLVAAIALLYYAGKKARRVARHWESWNGTQYWKFGVLLVVIAYSMFLLIDIHKFDRYFLPIYPLLIFLLASKTGNRTPRTFQKILALAALLIMATFSVIATDDYHSWQQARWNALEELMVEQNIDSTLIDGGFEFNGWYETGPMNPSGKTGKSWWFVHEDEYAVAKRPFECFEVIKKFPTNTWLNPVGDSLVILKRPSLDRSDTLFTDLETLSNDRETFIAADSLYAFRLGGILDTTVAFSGKHSVLLTPEKAFGISIELDSVQACEQITVTAWRLGKPWSAGSVLRAPDPEVLHSFEQYFTDQETEDGWMRLRHELSVPANYDQDTLHFYFWNPVIDSIWIDDVQIIRRRTEQ